MHADHGNMVGMEYWVEAKKLASQGEHLKAANTYLQAANKQFEESGPSSQLSLGYNSAAYHYSLVGEYQKLLTVMVKLWLLIRP